MIPITEQDLRAIGRREPNEITRGYAAAINVYSESFEVTTVKRMALFLALAEPETGGYRLVEENLNYTTPGRLVAVWPSRFANARFAADYTNNPEKLANFVYGGRLGNEGIPGAGWTYRGRGFFQTTGRTNYEQVEEATGLGVLADPDMLLDPDTGVRAAFLFWRARGLATRADREQVRAARGIVNGNPNMHLAEVQGAYQRATARLPRLVRQTGRGVAGLSAGLGARVQR